MRVCCVYPDVITALSLSEHIVLHHYHALLVRPGCRTSEIVWGVHGGRIGYLNFLIVRT